MQIPILNGIYTDENSDIRVAYPINMVPVALNSGIAKGYLRPSDGIIEFSSSTSGIDRGGINWNNACYRVIADKFVSVDSNGLIIEIDTIANNFLPVSFEYSFDYLGIVSAGNFYLYDGATLTQVTDTDLGTPIDLIWVDGYFMLTDGEYLIITELTDPFQISPLKYGASEFDPDPIVAVKKVGNEPYAINRYTIEAFDNIGGTGFPFQRIDGTRVTRGAVGTKTVCNFAGGLAFIGSGKNEPISIWASYESTSVKIATREIDIILQNYTENELSLSEVESRVERGHEFLYVHLSDKTLVYDFQVSKAADEPIWHILRSSIIDDQPYLARHFVYCYNKWIFGHPLTNKLGTFANNISSHWDEDIGWEFNTPIIYNESNSAIFFEIELVCLTGRVLFGDDPVIWTSYSIDGETWSQEKPIKTGMIGNRTKRLVWFNQGLLNNWRIQKFRGLSDSFISPIRLEIQIEGLID